MPNLVQEREEKQDQLVNNIVGSDGEVELDT
jgi:hypothetical protein